MKGKSLKWNITVGVSLFSRSKTTYWGNIFSGCDAKLKRNHCSCIRNGLEDISICQCNRKASPAGMQNARVRRSWGLVLRFQKASETRQHKAGSPFLEEVPARSLYKIVKVKSSCSKGTRTLLMPGSWNNYQGKL